ncbi:glutamate receptor ionotropic, kainate 2-like isoform X1 [Amphiura filiformis]|uniref:glutamate receptor ionotropic, kainate 2-like isoform X1 n=1 Tax=Amphiura filiformis TaxID=82378 RepID=UPI003B22451C
MDILRILLAAWFLCFRTLLLVHSQTSGQKVDTMKIGGIFRGSDDKRTEKEKAFRFAIDYMNRNKRRQFGELELRPSIKYLDKGDTYDAMGRACGLVKDIEDTSSGKKEGSGVVAIFGPSDSSTESSAAVQGVCENLDIPHIKTIWEQGEKQIPDGTIALNLHPSNWDIGRVIRDLVISYGWLNNGVAILYEDYNGLIRLTEVLKLNIQQIKIQELDTYLSTTLKAVKKSGFSHIIVDCKTETVPLLLDEMMKLQMLKSYFHYIFTSMDLITLPMQKYSGDDVNITAIHMVDFLNVSVRNIFNEWAEYADDTTRTTMPTAVALIFDAINVTDEGLRAALVSAPVQSESLACGTDKPVWDYGLTVANALKSVNYSTGLTGPISFHTNGTRENVRFFISELGPYGLEQVAKWTPMTGIKYNEKGGEAPSSLKNRTLRVTSVYEPPYIMKRETDSGETLHGNDAYEGFCVDMLEKIAQKVGIKYKIHIVKDGNYGSKDAETGKWNGMVGEILNDEADIAVAPLTITFVREQVIDFSKPYMHLGITILYRVPEPQNPGVFSFLNPLSFDIWMYVVMAYVVVSLTLFLLARFSPYEWYNEHPCNPEYDGVENQFNLLSCLWFAFGGLMQQGSEVNPRAFSTRVLSGFWWFFSLILVSSYTANLAAFLTVERMVSPIKNADELAAQTAIEYGTRSGGSTYTFFSRSKIDTYQKMWDFMSNKPSVFVDTYGDGVVRVLNTKNYALLIESTMAEFRISQHCKNLTQIGGLLNSRGYGIGMRQGDPIRDPITDAILQLQEEDEMLTLKNKWWRKGHCPTDDSQDNANELGLANIGGIFIVLIAGLLMGVIVAIGEFIWKTKQNAGAERKSLCEEMMAEIRFACRCKNRRKLIRESTDHKFMPSAPYPCGLNGQTFGMADTIN